MFAYGIDASRLLVPLARMATWPSPKRTETSSSVARRPFTREVFEFWKATGCSAGVVAARPDVVTGGVPRVVVPGVVVAGVVAPRAPARPSAVPGVPAAPRADVA